MKICEFAEERRLSADNDGINSIRTFTFGIGPYVNPTFLKTLAAVGRGHSQISLHKDVLETNILELMNKTTSPVLMNVCLEMETSGLNIEIYPFPIPDLYQVSYFAILQTASCNILTSISGLPSRRRWIVVR